MTNSANQTSATSATASTPAAPIPLLRRPITLPSAGPLYRATGVFGKDLAHHTKVVATMLAAACFAVYLPWLAAMLSKAGLDMKDITQGASTVYLALLITCAFVFGLVLSADEVENRTLSLLDTFPASRMRHFAHKFASGLVMLIVWALAAAVLMGYLSNNGMKLLNSLLYDKVQLFSVALDFPTTGPVTFLQCISLLLTGLVCGMLFQNLASGAMVGILAYCSYLAICSRLFYQKNYEPVTLSLINIGCLLAWAAVMIAAYPRVFRRSHELPSGPAYRFEAASKHWRDLTSFLQYRRTVSTVRPFLPPHIYVLRLPVVALCIFALVYPILMFDQLNHGPLVPMIYVIAVPCGLALIMSGVWTPEERLAPKCATYALPVSRQRIFWPRMAAVSMGGAAVGLTAALGIVVSIYIDANRNSRTLEAFPLEPILIISGSLFGLSFVSSMFRLFYKNRLIAATFACMVMFAWLLVGIHAWAGDAELHGYRGSQPEGRPVPTELVIYTAWMVAVVSGLPLLVSYLGFCRTRLLETSERTRGSVALVLFLLLLVWGSFLILTEPLQLLTILFVR